MQRPSTGISLPQSRLERPRKALKNDFGESRITSGTTRPATPGQNVLARPPSTTVTFNQTGGSRLATMSSISSGSMNVGLSIPGQMNMSMMERPITQYGVAGVRPGTGRGLSMAR